MDVDFLNLSPEAQMDLMNMIYMEKLAEFSQTAAPTPLFAANFATARSSQALHTPPTTPNSPVLLGAAPSLQLQYALPPPPPAELSSVAAMREVIFRIAAMQPVHIDPESVKPPKRRNVRISKDPQSVAARHRRERISEKIRILQRLVPGGTKMDTASMLDEAIHYVKFLKTQVQTLERAEAENRPGTAAADHAAAAAAAAGLGLGLGLGFACYSVLDDPGFPVRMLR